MFIDYISHQPWLCVLMGIVVNEQLCAGCVLMGIVVNEQLESSRLLTKAIEEGSEVPGSVLSISRESSVDGDVKNPEAGRDPGELLTVCSTLRASYVRKPPEVYVSFHWPHPLFA